MTSQGKVSSEKLAKKNNAKDNDCLSCKLISFGGLVGSGVYVAYYARLQKGLVGRSVLMSFSMGLGYVGVARLLNIYPFGRDNEAEQR